MDESEFLRGIEGEEQSGQDLVSGAEHLIRLKKQVGMTRPSDDLELEKEARIFGASPPNTIDHAAIPEAIRSRHFKDYANEKANEEPSGYLRGVGGGTAIGGGLGALMGASMGAHHGATGRGALIGGLIGGGLGALTGAGAAAGDKERINDMKKVVRDGSYDDAMAHHIADNADTQRSADWWNEERRHQSLRHALSKQASPLQEVLVTARIKTAAAGFGAIKQSLKSGLSNAADKIKGPARGFSNGFQETVRYPRMGVQHGISNVKGPAKAYGVGMMAGSAAIPAGAAAVGALGGYAAGHHGKEKSASLHQYLDNKLIEVREKTANAIVDRLKDHPGLVAATGLGALLGGIGTYAASRPQADSGKSRAEEDLEGKVEAQKGQPERGLLSKMHNRNTELEHGYAQAFREHPGKAAIIGTATGAMGGYGIGRLAGGLAKLRGGK